ncbi:hypothetical protein HanRHA438_Chr15g0683071 [Helianthus annuus]|nr:hypothetical protein HanRHA438_Chr15g0683071 [Helianthus annuus]
MSILVISGIPSFLADDSRPGMPSSSSPISISSDGVPKPAIGIDGGILRKTGGTEGTKP